MIMLKRVPHAGGGPYSEDSVTRMLKSKTDEERLDFANHVPSWKCPGHGTDSLGEAVSSRS